MVQAAAAQVPTSICRPLLVMELLQQCASVLGEELANRELRILPADRIRDRVRRGGW
jgi:hypothetical protein